MLKIMAVLVCTAGAAGCLSSNVVLTVRPDGSGTLEQTVQLRQSSMRDLVRLLPPETQPRPATRTAAAFPEPNQMTAGWMFGGVRVSSSRPISSGDVVGRQTIYAFDDVRTVEVDLMLDSPSGIPAFYRVAAVEPWAKTRLKFTLAPAAGGVQRLTAHFPKFRMDPLAEPPAGWASGSPEEMAALRRVLDGSRVTITVRTTTPLLQTNSPHRDGNQVTLLDADLAQALFSRQMDMLRATPATFDELIYAFADLPGVTLASEHDVTIDFEDPSAQAAAPPAAAAQAPPPDDEIFVAAVTADGGRLTLGTPTNITRSPGYDNQPFFTPDGRAILFTSARGGTAAPARTPPASAAPAPVPQTDIYRYDLVSRRTTRVTATPESEYSPTVTPDGAHISVIRVERDNTQRLWRFTLDGKDPQLVLADVKPVGYHAWVDDRTLALFILGERGAPATLQVADVATGAAVVVASGIGRSIQRMPSGPISFVQQPPAGGGASAMIKQLFNAKTSERGSIGVGDLIRAPAGATDPFVAWMPDGTLLMAHAGTLYRWRPGDAQFAAVASLDALGLTHVSRLAVSPKGDLLAIVGRMK